MYSLVGGYVSDASVFVPSGVIVMSICVGSGGGIGIDGVMHPAKTMRTSSRRMKPGKGYSKPRSRPCYPDLGDLRRQPANSVGGAATRGDYGVRLTVVGNMTERPAPKNRWCRKRLSSPSI